MVLNGSRIIQIVFGLFNVYLFAYHIRFMDTYRIKLR